MTIIVEDGTGLTDSESLISVQYFTDYHIARGNTNVSLLSTTESEEALRRAHDYLAQTYRGRWKGYLLKITQALDWPRSGVTLAEYTVDSNTIPVPVKNAIADLAFKAAGGELLSDLSQQVVRKKVDAIEVEYSPNARQTKRYLAIDNLLAPYLNGNSGITLGLVRS
jgi:hypothetical protein